MVEAGNILGALAAALLLMAVIAWVRLFRGQRMRRTGGRIEMESADGEFASELRSLGCRLERRGRVLRRRWLDLQIRAVLQIRAFPAMGVGLLIIGTAGAPVAEGGATLPPQGSTCK